MIAALAVLCFRSDACVLLMAITMKTIEQL